MTISYSLGAHEPLAHRLRTGHAATDEWQRFEQEVTDDALDRAVAIGADTVHIGAYKGFGLDYEAEFLARAADFAERARRRGLRVSVYVQGPPVYYETFLVEQPDASGWLVRNQFGQHVPWGFQVFRRYMCMNHPDFIAYQQRVLRVVLEATKPDHAIMDNVHWNPPPNDCHCDHCQAAFREHLQQTFGDRLEHETGLQSLTFVEIPSTDPIFYPPDSFRQFRDPIHQEYIRFRCLSLARHLRAMADTVRAVCPKTEFTCNAGCDNFRANQAYAAGQWLEDIDGVLDGWSLEEHCFRPRLEPDGAVVTKGRINKLAEFYGRTLGRSMWGETNDDERRVSLGEMLAFARGHVSGIGNLAAPEGYFDGIVPALNWAKGLAHSIAAGTIIAPIATLRLFASQAFVRFTPMHYACMTEQALFDAHLPFLIATDAVFDRLDEFGVLILPHQPALSDAQIEKLRAFVHRGGGLVLIGESATTDERLRVRIEHPFADAFDADALGELLEMGPPHFVPRVDISKLTQTITGQLGDGRIVWMPRLTPTSTVQWQRDPYFPFRSVLPEEVRPPAEAETLIDLIRTVSAAPLPVVVDAPRHVLAEYRRDAQRTYVHLVNLDTAAPAHDLTIRMTDVRADEAVMHEMEAPSRPLTIMAEPQGCAITIDRLTRYALVEITTGRA